ncbi:MAG: DMT family transporter [Chloroflexia bacterium]
MPATPPQPLTTNTTPRPFTSISRRTQSIRLRAYAALALGVVCIGFSAIFTKWVNLAGSVHVTGAVSAFHRVAIATLALSIPYGLYLARARRIQSSELKVQSEGAPDATLNLKPGALTSKLVWGTIIAGLFFALDLGFWNTSLLFTSAANATLLGNLSTLWVSLGALVIFHESLKRRFWAGMVIALVGVAIVVGRDVIEHPQLSWGDLLAVLSSTFYAAYILATNRVRQGLGTMHFMWINSAAATVLLLAYVLVTGEQLWGFEAGQWWSLVALGLVSHALGWMAINYSLGHLPAPLTSVSLLAQPVFTALVAVPLLGEGLAINQIGGGLLVLAGIYIVNRR